MVEGGKLPSGMMSLVFLFQIYPLAKFDSI